MSVTDCFVGSSILKVLEVKNNFSSRTSWETTCFLDYCCCCCYLRILRFFIVASRSILILNITQYTSTSHDSTCFGNTLLAATLLILIFRNPWEKNYTAKLFRDWQPFLLSRLKMFAGDMMGDGICSCSVNIFENAPSLVDIFHVGEKKGRFLEARL